MLSIIPLKERIEVRGLKEPGFFNHAVGTIESVSSLHQCAFSILNKLLSPSRKACFLIRSALSHRTRFLRSLLGISVTCPLSTKKAYFLIRSASSQRTRFLRSLLGTLCLDKLAAFLSSLSQMTANYTSFLCHVMKCGIFTLLELPSFFFRTFPLTTRSDSIPSFGLFTTVRTALLSWP